MARGEYPHLHPVTCVLCRRAPGDWTSPTGHVACHACLVETLRVDVRYWRDLAYRYWDELEELAV